MSPNDLTLGDMQSDSSVGEAAVLLRALDSLKLSELTEALRKAKESHSKIEHILSQGLNKAIQAKKSDEYWNFARSMSELTDEVKSYQLGVRASL